MAHLPRGALPQAPACSKTTSHAALQLFSLSATRAASCASVAVTLLMVSVKRRRVRRGPTRPAGVAKGVGVAMPPPSCGCAASIRPRALLLDSCG